MPEVNVPSQCKDTLLCVKRWSHNLKKTHRSFTVTEQTVVLKVVGKKAKLLQSGTISPSMHSDLREKNAASHPVHLTLVRKTKRCTTLAALTTEITCAIANG